MNAIEKAYREWKRESGVEAKLEEFRANHSSTTVHRVTVNNHTKARQRRSGHMNDIKQQNATTRANYE